MLLFSCLYLLFFRLCAACGLLPSWVVDPFHGSARIADVSFALASRVSGLDHVIISGHVTLCKGRVSVFVASVVSVDRRTRGLLAFLLVWACNICVAFCCSLRRFL